MKAHKVSTRSPPPLLLAPPPLLPLHPLLAQYRSRCWYVCMFVCVYNVCVGGRERARAREREIVM
jgi:hypothetical protein